MGEDVAVAVASAINAVAAVVVAVFDSIKLFLFVYDPTVWQNEWPNFLYVLKVFSLNIFYSFVLN